MAFQPTSRMVVFGAGTTAEALPQEFGNKAAVLVKMASLGIPVPPGFALGVTICDDYYRNNEVLPDYVDEMLKRGISHLEKATGLTFGSGRRPLLVSVRSGAPISMPGIMDTMLNIGLNREIIQGLIYMSGNPRFAWDTYRRYLENFGTIVLGYEGSKFQAILHEIMEDVGVTDETALDFKSLKLITGRYEAMLQRNGGPKFPENVYDQLRAASIAVLRSWNSPRAANFRRLNLVGAARGTAVTVQAMVFGNMGRFSGAGVAFSRNPWTGGKELVVDYKLGAQGEDVVSGSQGASTQKEMAHLMPEAYRDLQAVATRLEQYFKDMQDIEFTVQEARLFILQSRSGKRSPYAALRIAVEMVDEGLITPKVALRLLEGVDIDSIIIQRLNASGEPLGAGISASVGVAAGRIALTCERAEEDSARSPVILVRETASPDDIAGIKAAGGLLTARGARTSHAAVVARQMGKVCVVNCADLSIDLARHRINIGKAMLHEGDEITLDGSSGLVYAGHLSTTTEKPVDLLAKVAKWRKKKT
ncbi:MAG TPA: PEP/pyruvate-binding domain-containing protein [Methanocella sp.]|uniref:PEP/pyruvate-binding domain-containing protein n=1 Tax=Methanocella sp. TaxID=2052833 RepID=UPI002C02A7F8|nr:PEP/pyruvate-binding domain-containing protein [Methanocella sp.]HTY90608.1 PEP/pyruvate-binding domain-containing protein [Methanocella sp.]